VTDLHLVKTESGVGPSDHTSFYYEDIPVLHFFTGQHEDYHKPTDDSDKINSEGIVVVTDIVFNVVGRLHDETALAFTKTKDEDQSRASSFKVTLGVMPDYLYDQGGMRVDGVKEDRPAALGGIVKGDIILKMGDVDVEDIYDYMEALGTFSVGQTVLVKVKRGDEIMSMNVTF
jgi:S1-C subfamily serine protease